MRSSWIRKWLQNQESTKRSWHGFRPKIIVTLRPRRSTRWRRKPNTSQGAWWGRNSQVQVLAITVWWSLASEASSDKQQEGTWITAWTWTVGTLSTRASRQETPNCDRIQARRKLSMIPLSAAPTRTTPAGSPTPRWPRRGIRQWPRWASLSRALSKMIEASRSVAQWTASAHQRRNFRVHLLTHIASVIQSVTRTRERPSRRAKW